MDAHGSGDSEIEAFGAKHSNSSPFSTEADARPPMTRRQMIAAASGGLLAAAGITIAEAGERRHAGDQGGRRKGVAEQYPVLPVEQVLGRGPTSPEPAGRAAREPRAAPAGPAPIVAGLPWYEAFDTPVARDGAYWIGLGRGWGEVRGGHIVCFRPPAIRDADGAWPHYDQGQTNACAGFASSRAASLLNRRLFDGFLMYEAAKRYDRWRGDGYEGCSVDGALNALEHEGPFSVRLDGLSQPIAAAAIDSWTWANSVEETLAALCSREGFVRVLNSWGTSYPREVRLPIRSLDRIIAERAELGIVIDRAA